jgi:DNA polymerase III delta subunit
LEGQGGTTDAIDRRAPAQKIRLMPKPVYALVGADAFKQTQELRRILDQLPKDAQRIDADGERAQLADVLDEVRSFAMFGGMKLVVVNNADDFISNFREQMEDYCDKPVDSAVLVLRCNSLPKNQRIAKIIAKSGVIVECTPPSDREIVPWIVGRAKSEHKLTITPAAAEMLKDLIGDDLGRMDNELAKLALQCTSGKVDVDNVSCSVAFQREQEMWSMTDEMGAGQTTEALRRWRQLVQVDSSAEFRAVTWLGMWLEDVGYLLAGGSAGKCAWKYRDRLPLFIKTAQSLGRTGYARAVDQLAEADRRSKSGLGDAVSNVEQFILSFA